MSEVILKEKSDSIEVSENAKGQKTFKVKLYFDADVVIKNVVMADIKVKEAVSIYDQLHKVFA